MNCDSLINRLPVGVMIMRLYVNGKYPNKLHIKLLAVVGYL